MFRGAPIRERSMLLGPLFKDVPADPDAPDEPETPDADPEAPDADPEAPDADPEAPAPPEPADADSMPLIAVAPPSKSPGKVLFPESLSSSTSHSTFEAVSLLNFFNAGPVPSISVLPPSGAVSFSSSSNSSGSCFVFLF